MLTSTLNLPCREASPDLFDALDEIDESYLWPFLHLLDGAPKPVTKPVTKPVIKPVTKSFAEPFVQVKPSSSGPTTLRYPLRPISTNKSDELSPTYPIATPLSKSATRSAPHDPISLALCSIEFLDDPPHQPGETAACSVNRRRLRDTENRRTKQRGGFSLDRPTMFEPSTDSTHLDEFFAKYPEFPHNPAALVAEEFERMCCFFNVPGWTTDRATYKLKAFDRELEWELKRDFKNAMVKQFNAYYGTDVDDIKSWRHLCQVLNIFPIPRNLHQCRKAVLGVHVNLVDLVDTQKSGQPVRIFETLEELQGYTRKENKIFPQSSALAGGVLWFLLRKIF